jgi:hypothetical protein
LLGAACHSGLQVYDKTEITDYPPGHAFPKKSGRSTIAFSLKVKEFRITAPEFKELFVSSLFSNLTIVEHQNALCYSHCREAMGHQNGRTILSKFGKMLEHLIL